jgi:hypothetical protein
LMPRGVISGEKNGREIGPSQAGLGHRLARGFPHRMLCRRLLRLSNPGVNHGEGTIGKSGRPGQARSLAIFGFEKGRTYD